MSFTLDTQNKGKKLGSWNGKWTGCNIQERRDVGKKSRTTVSIHVMTVNRKSNEITGE